MSKRTRAAALGAAALAAGLGAYPVFFRRQCLTWGARPDEVSRKPARYTDSSCFDSTAYSRAKLSASSRVTLPTLRSDKSRTSPCAGLKS